MSVVRFGISLEEELLHALDDYMKENQFANRSQAVRNLINKNQVEKKWTCNNIVAGSITILFDHHKREIFQKLNKIQHDYHHVILASQYVQLNNNKSLEIIIAKGEAAVLTKLSDKIIAVKGVLHGKLTMSRAD